LFNSKVRKERTSFHGISQCHRLTNCLGPCGSFKSDGSLKHHMCPQLKATDQGSEQQVLLLQIKAQNKHYQLGQKYI